jgi:hypothetical protein
MVLDNQYAHRIASPAWYRRPDEREMSVRPHVSHLPLRLTTARWARLERKEGTCPAR